MARKLLLLLAIFVLLPIAAGSAWAKPSVSSVRIGVHTDKTRFVIELSEEPSYRIFTLPSPARVVIDLPELDWQLPAEQLPTTDQGLIKALRYGLFAAGTSRVVLDMRGPVGVKSVLSLPAGEGGNYRLVVDLQPVSTDVFFNPQERKAIVSRTPLPTPRAVAPKLAAKPKADDDRRPTIVIDAGHGGVDPGAIGVSGTYEKVIALDYARELKRALEETGRFRVVMTRDTDIFIRLRDRIALAQDADGDLFVSLHANTYKTNGIRGASVYTLSEDASDAEAAALARKENTADVIAGLDFGGQTEDVSMILIDLAQRETMNLSKNFANELVGEMGKVTKLLKNTHRFAGFAVLKSPTIPSVLVEIGYMSNREEERLLLSEAHRRKLSTSIVRAVERFFTWQESLRRS